VYLRFNGSLNHGATADHVNEKLENELLITRKSNESDVVILAEQYVSCAKISEIKVNRMALESQTS